MSENLMNDEIGIQLERLGIAYGPCEEGESVLEMCKQFYDSEIPAPLQEFIRSIQIPDDASYSAPFRLSYEDEEEESGFDMISPVMLETQEDLAGAEYVSLMMFEITQDIVVFSLKDETPSDPILYFMSHDDGEIDEFSVPMSEFFKKLNRDS